jgi:hypothetical protein
MVAMRGHRKKRRRTKAGRVARSAAASTGFSHNEETLRDVEKEGEAKGCWTDWRRSPHSGQAALGERLTLKVYDARELQ